MPFEIVRNDIVNMRVDAIVNTANPKPVIGYGVDAGIHRKAGPKLLEARQKIGTIRVGDAAISPGFDLYAKYVIHAVGPVWQGGEKNEEKLLRRCYDRSLELARANKCQSIAFPLMSAGNHGFPKPLALQIAMNAISDFLMKHEMMVYLVVFSRDAFQLSEKLFRSVASFIDEHYILEKNLQQYGIDNKCAVRDIQQQMILQEQMDRRRLLAETQAVEAIRETETSAAPDESAFVPFPFESAETHIQPPQKKEPRPVFHAAPMKAAAKAPKMQAPKPSFSLPFRRGKRSLAELLKETDAGFSETLLKLIDETGKKDSQIYTKANVSRQHFSKIRNNPDYKPTKATALAFAIALELDMEQTMDLISRAGYTLTNSSKFDVIIMYFIQEKHYDLCDINAALFEFDQSLLGA